MYDRARREIIIFITHTNNSGPQVFQHIHQCIEYIQYTSPIIFTQSALTHARNSVQCVGFLKMFIYVDF